ncbi:MAG: hypothetical protein KatS3mg008_0428 [Acidimicrobiales bacterium]|nr:MAG: hypothetical protein KatS3mg008_0428 [Acidimicrobiales bacterium]
MRAEGDRPVVIAVVGDDGRTGAGSRVRSESLP